MFFGSVSSKTAKKAETDHILRQMTKQREEIKKRLHQMSEVNRQLDVAVKETQEISLDLIEKLRKELKVAKKSITSICSKLKEGIILVDHLGNVIQLNKAGEKLFEIENTLVAGKSFSEVVGWLDPSIVDGETETKITLDTDFFSHLSNKLISKLTKCNCVKNNYSFCNKCLKKELPVCFDNEQIINAFASASTKPIRVTFSFSILDNDPHTLDDVIYIFIFGRALPDGIKRRGYEMN